MILNSCKLAHRVNYRDVIYKFVGTSNVPDIAFTYTPSLKINNFERPLGRPRRGEAHEVPNNSRLTTQNTPSDH